MLNKIRHKFTSKSFFLNSLNLNRKMHIQFIPMWWGSGDNYSYIVTDEATKDSIVIDPAEPSIVLPVLKRLSEDGSINLKAIVNTHHHYDHAGGNKALKHSYPSLPIIGGKDSNLVSKIPNNNSTFKIGNDITVTALHTPCHTRDSICYYIQDKDQKALFTGDTLFTCGCGRFFEGTPDEMNIALNKILGSLPDDTKIYPGHEYTKSNVKFAKTVLTNKALIDLENFANTHEFTTGVFTLKDEKSFNPFMRLNDPEIQAKVHSNIPNEVMKILRDRKNNS